MKILLVWAYAESGTAKLMGRTTDIASREKGQYVPLSLATIAGLTPPEHEVQIWDEVVQGPAEMNLDDGYELVGLTGYSDSLERAIEIAAAFRAKGAKVVMGGAGVTSDPEVVRPHMDAIFIGEAETTWPRYLSDLAAGQTSKVYRAEQYPDLSLSPPPRWDSIAATLSQTYKWGAAQVNRGCPHRCEFCNVWTDFGRKIRNKSIPQVLEELTTLRKLGVKRVMLCSDNFIGDPRYAKKLLHALIPFNQGPGRQMFSTEITIKVAENEEFLRLHAEAGFTIFGIGLETPNVESLTETRKHHNTKDDMVAQCRKIAAHGILVAGSLVVGFDNDKTDIFDRQFRFIQDAYILSPSLSILRAITGTDLHKRMRAAGRLVQLSESFPIQVLDDARMNCNLVLGGMLRSELYAGYLDLMERVWDWHNFRDRAIGFIDNVEHLPSARKPTPELFAASEHMREKIRLAPGANAAVIDEILDHTRDRVPALGLLMANITMAHCYEVARVPASRRSLEEHIRMEREAEQRGGLVMLPAVA